MQEYDTPNKGILLRFVANIDECMSRHMNLQAYKMQKNDHLLTNESASQLLSISPRALVRLRESGQIPFVKVSDSPKSYRYSALALSDFIAKRQQIAQSSPMNGPALSIGDAA
jgi:hypothetical protein